MNDPLTLEDLLSDEALARADRRLDDLIYGATLGPPAYESYLRNPPTIWPPDAQ